MSLAAAASRSYLSGDDPETATSGPISTPLDWEFVVRPRKLPQVRTHLRLSLLGAALLLGCSPDISKPQEWPAKSLDAELKTTVELTTTWHDGNLYYRLALSAENFKDRFPTKKTGPFSFVCIRLQDGNYLDTLILKFLDDGDFALAEIRIGVSTMRKDTDDDDKSIRSLRAEGKIPLSEKLYRAMRKWELWRSTDNILCAR
jgi:hypothetical protein